MQAVHRGHSANVRMELHLNGHVLPITHLAGDFLIVSSPIDHPAAEAEITMSVDGSESRWRVRLPEGASSSEPRTRIVKAG